MDAEKPEQWFSNEAATFGDRLSAAREAAGLTQEDLAARLGVRMTTLQAWEDDGAEPRGNRLQMLAGMLNVSLMWLMSGEGDGLDGPASGDTEENANAARAAGSAPHLGSGERADDRLGRPAGGLNEPTRF